MEPVRTIVVEPTGAEPSLTTATFAGCAAVECRRTVASAEAAVTALAGTAPVDCVVVRHDPPAVDAVAVVDRLRAARPDVAVVVAVAPAAVEAVVAAEPNELLELRADGSVAPDVAAVRLRSAVELAAARSDDDILAALTDAMPDYAFVLDGDGRYLDVLAGRQGDGGEPLKPADLRGNRLGDVLPEAAARTLRSGVTAALERDVTVDRTYRLPGPDGDRWFEGRLAPLDDTYRGDAAVLLVAREVTERRQREAEAEETRAELARTLERISDGVVALTEDWTVTYANEAGADVLRGAMALPADAAVVGRQLWDGTPAADDTDFHEHYQEAMATQTPVSFEWHHEPAGVWFDVTAYPDPDGLSVFFSDVSHRERREQALNGLLEAAESLMRAHSPNDIADIISDAAADILGYPANAVRLYDAETGLLEPVAVTDRTEVLMGEREPYGPGDGISGRAFADGVPAYVPNVRERRDNPAYTDVGAVYAHPLGDHGVVTVGTTEADGIDESDRTLVAILAATAETALSRADREAERRQLGRIVDHVGGQLFLLDESNRIGFATAAFADALGYDRAALADRPLDDLFVEETTAATDAAAAIEAVRTGERPTATVETTVRTADGGARPVELEFSAVETAGPDAAVAGAMTDIRKLTTTREALASERDRFRELFEVLPVPVTEVRIEDGTSVVEFVNEAFTEMFGYDRATVQDEALNGFIAPVGDDSADLDRRVADGEELAVEVQRETVDGPRDFLLRATPYTRDGELRAFGIYTDITAQRERERYLTILNRVLRHNFRNDLTVVIGFAEALAAAVDDETLVSHAERILAAGESLSGLSERARELEALVGNKTREQTPVDAVEHLDAALEACEATARAEVSLDVADTPLILAGERVQQVFTELITNAIEHADHEWPQLTIRTGRTADGRVAIRFTDDGPGIPSNEWDVIAGDTEITQLHHGTGLGLWLVRWIVDSYNGTLSRSRNPTGTTVTVTFEPAE